VSARACDSFQQIRHIPVSFSRADTWNFMAMQGPDFKSQFVDPAPASNADLGRTIAQLMQLNPHDKSALLGRVLEETLPGGTVPAVAGRVLKSVPAANGLVTVSICRRSERRAISMRRDFPAELWA
jgi:hypothetical protein